MGSDALPEMACGIKGGPAQSSWSLTQTQRDTCLKIAALPVPNEDLWIFQVDSRCTSMSVVTGAYTFLTVSTPSGCAALISSKQIINKCMLANPWQYLHMGNHTHINGSSGLSTVTPNLSIIGGAHTGWLEVKRSKGDRKTHRHNGIAQTFTFNSNGDKGYCTFCFLLAHCIKNIVRDYTGSPSASVTVGHIAGSPVASAHTKIMKKSCWSIFVYERMVPCCNRFTVGVGCSSSVLPVRRWRRLNNLNFRMKGDSIPKKKKTAKD
jgi:hypothetical protein